MAGPFGTIRDVYFEFFYDNKWVRIPTFTSRRMKMVTSSWVTTGISKADAFRDALLRAQKVDSSFSLSDYGEKEWRLNLF